MMLKGENMLSDKELDKLFYKKSSGIHGEGLFARNQLNKGDYMGEYNGPEVIDNGSHVLWIEDDDAEQWVEENGSKWIGRNGQNLLRYLNHSKKPHAEFTGFKLYALRNISADEEITIDYGEEP